MKKKVGGETTTSNSSGFSTITDRIGISIIDSSKLGNENRSGEGASRSPSLYTWCRAGAN
eukprot:7805153-Ditylum_brightwellii.AAC.1